MEVPRFCTCAVIRRHYLFINSPSSPDLASLSRGTKSPEVAFCPALRAVLAETTHLRRNRAPGRHIHKNFFIPDGLYHFARHQLTYGSRQDRRFACDFYERWGGYYGGSLNEFRVHGNYPPTAKFSISVSETWDRYRFPLPNGNFSVVLARLQANYSFSRFLSFTSLIQMDTANTQAISANLRLRYNYRRRGCEVTLAIQQGWEMA